MSITSQSNGSVVVASTAGNIPTLQTASFLTGGTWNSPITGIAFVQAFGGGGGGAGGTTNVNASAGGGGGSLQSTVAVFVTSGTNYSVTIGAGGAGGSAGTNGNPGGNTSFGSLVSFCGASGGQAYTGVANQNTIAAAGGLATTVTGSNNYAMTSDGRACQNATGAGGASLPATLNTGWPGSESSVGNFQGGAGGPQGVGGFIGHAPGGGGGAGPAGNGGAGGAPANPASAAAGTSATANTGADGGGAGWSGAGAVGGDGGSGMLIVIYSA